MKSLIKYLLLFCLILTTFAFTKPDNIDPDIDYYRKAMDAWKKQDNISLAVKNMRLSYFQKPDSYRLYWYTYFLSREKMYDETIEVVENAPESHIYPCAYGTYIYRYYATALLMKDRRKDAVDVLIKAFRLKEKSASRRAKVINDLVVYNSKVGGLTQEFRAHPEYDNVVDEIVEWIHEDENNSKGAALSLFRYFLVTAVCNTVDDDSSNDRYIDKYLNEMNYVAQTGLKKNREYAVQAKFFKNAVKYWQKNKKLRDKAYNFKFCGVFISDIDAVVGRGNKKYRRKNSMSNELINRLISENLDHAHAASLAYFFMSEGKVNISFDYKIHKGVLRNIANNNIDRNSISPHHGPLMYKNFNEYDGFMYMYDYTATHPFFGGAGTVLFSPYDLSSEFWRFKTWMKTGANYSTYIHEIFHNFEASYKIGPTHCYLAVRKGSWPEWYKETVKRENCNAQISYYHGRFIRDINLKGFDRIKFRINKKTQIDHETVLKANERYKSVSEIQVKMSYDHFYKGEALYKKRKFKAAMKEYETALKLYKWNPHAVYRMAWTTKWKLKDSKGAVKYYELYLDRFGGYNQTGSCAYWVVWNEYMHEKNYKKVIEVMEKYGKFVWEEQKRVQVLYMQAIAYRKAGEVQKEIPLLQEAVKLNSSWNKRIKVELDKSNKELYR